MNNTPDINLDNPIRSVLIVDDEASLRLILTRSLNRAGFTCKETEDGESAYGLILENRFDLVISDISMPGIDGMELLEKVKKKFPDIEFIMMTGYASEYSYVDIMNAGASDYMTKPFNINSAIARISRIAREKSNLIRLKKANIELKNTIERANALAEEARSASKAKTYFLASMSHEIRTPLNGIVGYTDMLMDTTLNGEQKEFVKNARLSCETLLSVVNDILDFSKVEAGKLSLEIIEFDPEVICFDTIELVRTKVDESRVEMICTVSDMVPGKVRGDPHRFRQVLLNLLGNAAKFTRNGTIKLAIDAQEDQELYPGQVCLIVTIQDTGIGIAEKDLERIFQPFSQSEDDMVINRYGGTGLGLAISRNIAQKMNGTITARSNLNQGSRFVFSAWFKKADTRSRRRVSRPVSLSDKHGLLCYSTGETRDILQHELKKAGMKVTVIPFRDLRHFMQTGDTGQVDIGIVDFGKLSRNIETDTNSSITRLMDIDFRFPLIACTNPFPGVADRLNRLGFKGYLPKPVQKRKLFDMISFVLGMIPQPAGDTQVSDRDEIVTSHLMAENIKQSAAILLVEDNPVNQKMTKILLTKAGYTIEIAGDGLEAVEKYTKAPMDFDLIFMDINMPKMNGYQATEKIRRFERESTSGNRIPILALTANVMDDFKKRCLEVGMDDFLTKPIKRELVFSAIQKWIKNK